MAFFYDDPSLLTRVKWYFVAESHEVFSPPTPFRSRVWEVLDETEPVLGERYSPRPWSGGLPGSNVSSGGTCGTVKQWEFGASKYDPVPAIYPDSTSHVCCSPPPEIGRAAIGFGAFGKETACCPGLFLPGVTMQVSFLAGSTCYLSLDTSFFCAPNSLPVPAVLNPTVDFLSDSFDYKGASTRLACYCLDNSGGYFGASFVSEDLQTLVLEFVASSYAPCQASEGIIVFFDPFDQTPPACQMEFTCS